jgi:hypothetical protein
MHGGKGHPQAIQRSGTSTLPKLKQDIVARSQAEKWGVCEVHSGQKTNGAVCPVQQHHAYQY